MEQIRIIIVDDHEVVRIGLKTFLAKQQDFYIVGEASSAREAVEKTLLLKPHVVLMDVRMPGTSGIEACRQIIEVAPETNVLMLTSYSDEESIVASIMAGAKGYVLKQVDTSSLVNNIRLVKEGKSLLDPDITDKVLAKFRQLTSMTMDRRESQFDLDSLTVQERKILKLVAEGLTNKEIATQLYLSPKTVRNYITNILHKLNLTNRTQAAAFVASMGLELDSE